MSQQEAKKIAIKFVKLLKEKKFPLSSAYLFGSYARGDNNKYSDIDLAIVSKLKRKTEKREDSLMMLRHEIDSKIEPHYFSANEFKDKSLILVNEVKKTGIKIL